MVVKQHSFKVDLENPDEKAINEFLQGKPTTYIVVEALKQYMRIEQGKQAAIDKMISNMQLFAPQGGQAPQATPAAKDSIKDFDM